MDFQLQIEYLGTDRERAQITFSDPTGLTSISLAITEWSTTDGEIRTVMGHFDPQVKAVQLTDGVLTFTAEKLRGITG